jgi:very-short-patch-repair endonuclease
MERVRNSKPFRMGQARYLRKQMTVGEEHLWEALRGKNIGYRVRRQCSAFGYILDFYVHAARLCIEIDGPLHDSEHDRVRDEKLLEHGILTLRIPAEELPALLEPWLAEIRRLCSERAQYRHGP